MNARASLLLAALGVVACAQAPAGVDIAIDLAGLTVPAADPGTPVVDELGVADLSIYPVFLMVRVEADDLDAPVVATWPEVVPGDDAAAVDLELEVEPGRDRRVLVDLVVAEEGWAPRTLVSPGPGESPASVEVAAGRVAEVTPELSELGNATIRASFAGTREVASVRWVDDRLGAALPPALAEGGVAEAEVAVGRTYWPRVSLADGSTLDLAAQSARVDAPDATLDVSLELD